MMSHHCRSDSALQTAWHRTPPDDITARSCDLQSEQLLGCLPPCRIHQHISNWSVFRLTCTHVHVLDRGRLAFWCIHVLCIHVLCSTGSHSNWFSDSNWIFYLTLTDYLSLTLSTFVCNWLIWLPLTLIHSLWIYVWLQMTQNLTNSDLWV